MNPYKLLSELDNVIALKIIQNHSLHRDLQYYDDKQSAYNKVGRIHLVEDDNLPEEYNKLMDEWNQVRLSISLFLSKSLTRKQQKEYVDDAFRFSSLENVK